MDPFFKKLKNRILFNSENFDKSKIYLNNIPENNLTKFLEKEIYSFTNYPYYLWIASIILFSTFMFLTYLLIFDVPHEHRYIIHILLDLWLFYISFYLFYTGKIESFSINRKKIEFKLRFKDINHIEIVLKGNKKGEYDSRKYFIRIVTKISKKQIEFGNTWKLHKIKEKYQICLAMIKGIILPNVADNLVKNESKYEDYIY